MAITCAPSGQEFGQNLLFAPIGLLDMYNSGGVVDTMYWIIELSEGIIKTKGKCCGRFGAYSNIKPQRCMLDMKEEEFTYNAEDGLLTVKLHGECKLRDIEFVY